MITSSQCGPLIPFEYARILTREEIRQEIVAEARTWLKTPFDPGQMCKGAGCDCGTLLLGVLSNVGLVPPTLLDEYRERSPMFWAHSKDDRYLIRVMRHAKKLLESVAYRCLKIEPGCLILTHPRSTDKRCHGAIVTVWPKVIHAISPVVVEVDATKDSMWAFKPIEVFDPLQPPNEEIK